MFFPLVVIDVGLSDNHTDHQNAVDAMLLTGTPELDRRDDAVRRAVEKLQVAACFAEYSAFSKIQNESTKPGNFRQWI